MSLNIASMIELSGPEKSCCIHGEWLTICHAAHLTGDHTIIVKNIQYVIPHLLKRHSRMRARLHIEGYQHSLQIFDYDEKQLHANLFYSIVNTNDQSWEKIVENECNRNPYSDNGKTIFPLFYFMLILNENSSPLNDNLFHLLLFSNHCASDGRSGYILINDLLTLVTSSDLCDRIEPVNTLVIPCLTELTPRLHGLVFRLKSWIEKQIDKRELRELNHPCIPVKAIRLDSEPTPFRCQPVKNNFLFTSSSSTLYSRLHEKCRSQQVTLNGPLLGCLLLAFHHYFSSEKKGNRSLTPFVVGFSVDMRSRLPQSPLTLQTVGSYANLCDVKLKKQLPLLSTPFWTLAKKCMRATNKVLGSEELRFTTHFYDCIVRNERKYDQLSQFYPDGLISELFFSNVGKYPFPCDYNEGQVRLRGLHVINNCSVYYTTAIFFVTCVGDGQLDFSLTHLMESEEKALEFLNYYVHLVEACADADIGITLNQLLSAAKSA
jgi:hypothetical protein